MKNAKDLEAACELSVHLRSRFEFPCKGWLECVHFHNVVLIHEEQSMCNLTDSYVLNRVLIFRPERPMRALFLVLVTPCVPDGQTSSTTAANMPALFLSQRRYGVCKNTRVCFS